MKGRKLIPLFFLGALCALLLSGCKGQALPEGMNESEVLSAGEEIVDLLRQEAYDEVVSRFREDVRENSSITAQTLEDMMSTIGDAGSYVQVSGTLVTGSTEGEPHGIAVLLCKYSKKTIRFRIAFDPEMNLIGMQVERK